MTLEQFKKIKIEAMREGDKIKVAALNQIINKLMLATIEKRAVNQEIQEGDVVSILRKTEGELIEEKTAFEAVGRSENVQVLEKQLAIVRSYLPAQLSREDIRKEISALTDQSLPAVMKYFKTNFAGKCDMKIVGEILKQL